MIRNLVPTANADFLGLLFTEFEGFRSSETILKSQTNRGGRQFGIAVLQFGSLECARRAVDNMNYTKLDGVRLNMTLADRDTLQILRRGQNRILLENFDRGVEDSQMHEALSNYGEVVYCHISRDEAGVSKCRCYAQFRDAEAAREASEELSVALIDGLPLRVRLVAAKPPRPSPAVFGQPLW
jgi:polyadenylate-binding protein